jgi:hypothetical protein
MGVFVELRYEAKRFVSIRFWLVYVWPELFTIYFAGVNTPRIWPREVMIIWG